MLHIRNCHRMDTLSKLGVQDCSTAFGVPSSVGEIPELKKKPLSNMLRGFLVIMLPKKLVGVLVLFVLV